MTHVPGIGIALLADGELVDDRSLEALDADSFGHADFVQELAGVVCRTNTPANVALFGPWGSGKSGIANLLESELPKDRKALRFVTFDASKYAEAPLRRHFISQVAHGLDIKADCYHTGLYTGIESRDVKFRPGEWAKLTAWFLTSVLLTLLVLLVIATIVASLSTGPFEDNWSSIVKDYLLATLPVAAVITAFVKLAADGFHLTTTRSAPSGHEEFEKRFKDLVADAGTERLVVFIDELDRCSPAQVASTLETMKTFLFIEGCVFIVAADQQVLEQALRRRVRQHTPEDSANPYYSAGSSYLDKVFQYQLTLPPLKAPTLSRFALKLIEGLPGVWQRVEPSDEVISVLTPTHVVSPRRVKVLLNRFAIAYRLAERRALEGHLDPNFSGRATELAKLVCLQCEFPLFAEDLTFDARLAEFVRMSADQETLPPNVRAEVAQRARAYAEGRRVVAELLVETDLADDEDPRDADTGDETSVDETDAEAGVDEPEVHDESDDVGPPRANAVAKEHAQQLVSYLRKTRHISGPAPDLLYLESAGASHGVDAVLADRLQRAAIDNETVEVLALVASAADDNGQGRGALLVLADVVRQAQPGLEGRNVVSALMQGIERSGVDLDDAADPIADAIASHLDQAPLAEEDLLGALTLARESSRNVGPKLLDAVLRHPASTQRREVALALLERASEVHEELRPRLAVAAKTALLQDSEAAAAQLLLLPDDDARQVLRDTTTPLEQASQSHYDAVEAQGEEGAGADTAGLLDPPPHEALGTAFDATIEAASSLSVDVAILMLALDRVELRNAVAARLHRLAPITNETLVTAVLRATHRRALADWPTWLDRLDAQTVAGSQGMQEWVDSLSVDLWNKAGADEPPSTSDFDIALAALGRCAKHVSLDADLRARIGNALEGAFGTDGVVRAQRVALERADKFVGAGVLDASALASIDLSASAQTLEAAMAATPAAQRTEVDAALVARVRKSAFLASHEQLERTLEAAPKASWLSAADRASVSLNAATALYRHQADVESPLDLDDLRGLSEEAAEGETADEALALWLGTFANTSDEVWHVLEPLGGQPLPVKTRAALSRFTQGLDGAARFRLIDKALERALTDPIDPSFLQAAHLSEVSQQQFAERLIELFSQTEDSSSQGAVMSLWQQFGPTSQGVRRRLVEAVYLPLVASDDEGLDLALSYFGLVASVKDVRRAVRQALRDSARTDEQRRRVDARLLEAKWTRKSMFGLGPARDED